MTRQASARKLGINFIPAQRTGVIEGIDAARNLLPRCWFDQTKCEKGIKALENYKKEWNERTGTWNSQPRHDQYSHGADAFRTLATGITYITNYQISAAEKERAALEKLKDASGRYPGSYLYTPEEKFDNFNTKFF
jgi:hypothetical protein